MNRAGHDAIRCMAVRGAVPAPHALLSWRPGPRRRYPLYASRVSAGFPSPADDHLETALSLDELLVARPAATFFVRVAGDSMQDAGIRDGDLLVVDRSLDPASGRVVIAVVAGEVTVKRYVLRGERAYLCPEAAGFAEIEITEASEATVWGVVTSVIHRL